MLEYVVVDTVVRLDFVELDDDVVLENVVVDGAVLRDSVELNTDGVLQRAVVDTVVRLDRVDPDTGMKSKSRFLESCGRRGPQDKYKKASKKNHIKLGGTGTCVKTFNTCSRRFCGPRTLPRQPFHCILLQLPDAGSSPGNRSNRSWMQHKSSAQESFKPERHARMIVPRDHPRRTK